LPLPLAVAQLQVLALSRQMQLLHRQRAGLLQLLEQQGLLPEQQQAIPAVAGDEAGTSISSSSSSSCSAAIAVQQAHIPAILDTWTVLLNLHVTAPCLPTDRLLDCLHLLLMVGPSSSDQQQVHASVGRDAPAGYEAAAALPAGATGVVADVALLVLPAAAQQEVQQLLLPAMRQEVQAAQQQEQMLLQQQQQGSIELQSAEYFARLSMAVEHGAWQHYRQMANDVYAVLQLSAAAAVLDDAAVPAAEGQHDPAAEAVVMVVAHTDDADAAAAAPTAAAAAEAASPVAALQHLADVLLFPLLLPFLATQGLHNMLRLLLMCLPPHLQLQWQQQQYVRLQHLVAAAPAPLQLPALLVEQQQAAEVAAAAGQHDEQAAAAAALTAVVEPPPEQQQQDQQLQQQQEQQTSAAPASAARSGYGSGVSGKSGSSSSSTVAPDTSKGGDQGGASEVGKRVVTVDQVEHAGLQAGDVKRSTAAAGAAAATSLAAGHEEGVAAAEDAAAAAAVAAAAAEAAAAGVPWYMPFKQFENGDLEQRCVAT
jgi:hypothetical protein